jgi:hypothetical protein
MIDIATERLLNLQQAAELLPPARAGRPVHAATVFKLIKSRRLEGLRINRRWTTSVEALQRYAERQTIAALGESPSAPAEVRMSRQRQRAIAHADAEAEAIWGR